MSDIKQELDGYVERSFGDPETLTLDTVKTILPKHLRANLTEEHIENINSIILDSECAEGYRDNLLSYSGVLQEGRYKLQQYIDAVNYVSHKMLGATNIAAYIKTFPERYSSHIAKGTSELQIHSICSAYNRNQLVAKVFEQTLIPTHILNADLHQKAINHLAHLMVNARSEKVQGDCAAKLVDALKIPDTIKMELDIGFKENDVIAELRDTMQEFSKQQKLSIESGFATPKEIAHSKIIEAEVIDG